MSILSPKLYSRPYSPVSKFYLRGGHSVSWGSGVQNIFIKDIKVIIPVLGANGFFPIIILDHLGIQWHKDEKLRVVFLGIPEPSSAACVQYSIQMQFFVDGLFNKVPVYSNILS